jgi:predicted ATP-binding protein involved in virulence
MKIQTLAIKDIAGIKNLHLRFDERMNIICGPNGIGKTTILECCAHSFSAGATAVLKSRAGAKDEGELKGSVETGLKDGSALSIVNLKVNYHDPMRQSEPFGNHEKAAYVLSLKTGRIFSYQPLDAVRKDAEKSSHDLIEGVKNGVSSSDIKSWFVNRDMYSTKDKAMSAEQLANFELAKQCFSKLNAAFTFSHVSANSLDIFVNTPGGQIVHEYLSSGFKSCLVMLLGIIKELELRFKNVKVEDIEAIVLIDEIELHLHPDWQGRIAGVLTDVFPKMQFIVTTHSPHVIQAAERNQIVALEANDGVVTQRELPESPHGFKGWTVDEVLTGVMGMGDTRTDFFNSRMTAFEKALDTDDRSGAQAAFDELDPALHPRSPLRKLLKLQLAGVGAGHDD